MNKQKKQQYERSGTLTLEQVFPLIEKYYYNKDRVRVNIEEHFVNVSSLRLKSFLLHGTNCSCCENKAAFFAVERDNGSNSSYHLNLYGFDKDGAEILFTHDHILARGLGGSDTIDNTRTSCGPCNWQKGQLEHLIKNSKDEKDREVLLYKLQQFLPPTTIIKPKLI